jgi:predicted TIM-barrel fold metal-dependent hydrolase
MAVLEAREALDGLAGQIVDVDSHEMIPVHLWPEMFGEGTSACAQLISSAHEPGGINSLVAGVHSDEGSITAGTASWQAGVVAPGAYDLERRLDWLDFCGIDRQLIFPTGPGLYGMLFLTMTPDRVKELLGLEVTAEVLRHQGLANVEGYNDWAMKSAGVSDRLRPVGVVDTTDLSEAVETTKQLISAGIRAISIPAGMPVGGLSPGHPDTGVLWELLESNDIPVLLHVGGEFSFLNSSVWGLFGDEFDKSVNMSGRRAIVQEVPLGPYAWCQLGLGNQNFLLTMIFGGALERHPNLRIGCIETGAQWIGPLVENMEHVATQFPRWTKRLSLSPREYVERNVRVTPLHWEPIDKYIERYGLESVYAYGSDYPHYEGGHDPALTYAARLAPLGSDVLKKFFIENGALLWP